MNAWALLVVSSEAQAETIPHQRAWAKEAAKERGWLVEREWPGVSSGKDGARKLVREMLAALTVAPADVRPEWLMMTRLDRIGRNALECQITLRDIHALGVKVWTREAGEEKGDTAMERLVSTVKLYVAEQENDVRRDKLKAVYKRKREAGQAVGNRRAYGLTIGPDKTDIAVPELAEAVRLAFELRITGATYYAIAAKLLEVAPPYRFKTREVAVRWSAARVKRLLTNRAYIGPVVDEVTFARAQRNTGIERRPRKHVWELAGAPLRCYCGRAMAGNYTPHPRDPSKPGHRYYRCFAGWNHEGWGRLVKAADLEQQLADTIASFAANPALIATYRPPLDAPSQGLGVRALSAARRKLEDVERQKARIWDLHAAGKLADEHLQPRLAELAETRTELLAQIESLRTQQVLVTHARGAEESAERAIAAVAAEYAEALPEARVDLVRIVAAHLGGGLCAEADGTLSFRVPVEIRQNRGSYVRKVNRA